MSAQRSEQEELPRRLELYVRSLMPRGNSEQQERTVSRMERLKNEAHVEEFSVTVWGPRTCLSTAVARTDVGQEINDRLAEFTAWAQDNDLTLRPFFGIRTVGAQFLNEQYTTVTLPVMTLAEFDDDGLRFVAPSTDGDRVHTVADRLDRLMAAADIGDERTEVTRNDDHPERVERSRAPPTE